MKKLINLIVRDAENIIYQGEVDRISSFNEVGRFDIYPRHANFISIIKKELTLYNNHKIVKQLKLEQAVLKVKKDNAGIFLGIDTIMIDENISNKPNKSNVQNPSSS